MTYLTSENKISAKDFNQVGKKQANRRVRESRAPAPPVVLDEADTASVSLEGVGSLPDYWDRLLKFAGSRDARYANTGDHGVRQLGYGMQWREVYETSIALNQGGLK